MRTGKAKRGYISSPGNLMQGIVIGAIIGGLFVYLVMTGKINIGSFGKAIAP